LPKKFVCWKDAIRGGLLAACIWELGRFVLGAFLIGMRYSSAYGAVGSFIAILLWCYYGISILFFGAEYVQVLQLRRSGVPTTGHPLESPKAEVPALALASVNQTASEAVDVEELFESEETTRKRFAMASESVRQTPRRAMEKSN
jgi:membrane protein